MIPTRLSNLESENLELNQQVGELGRALGQEAAAYQAQVLMMVTVVIMVTVVVMMLNMVVTELTSNGKVAAKEQELRRLQEELRQQGDQYTRLLDTKVCADGDQIDWGKW